MPEPKTLHPDEHPFAAGPQEWVWTVPKTLHPDKHPFAAGPQEWVWQELKTLAEMQFLFQVGVLSPT
jgi:hypothetical protein